jgi:purine nucleosidase
MLLLSQTAKMQARRAADQTTTTSSSSSSSSCGIQTTIELIGVSVTPADCIGEPAAEATLRLLDICDASTVPVGLATLKGETEFPLDWRLDAFKVAAFPVLHQPRFARSARLSDVSGQQLMLDTLRAHSDVTLVMTGPLTNLAWCLAQDASIVDHIAEVVIMGGALDCAGNVQSEFIKPSETHDMSAEWNIYWDSASAAVVLQQFPSLRIRLFSLDVTNFVPIDDKFLFEAFGRQFDYLLSNIGGTIYSLIAGHTFRTEMPYCNDCVVSYIQLNLCLY